MKRSACCRWQQLVLILALQQIFCHLQTAAFTKLCTTKFITQHSNTNLTAENLQLQYKKYMNGCEYIHGDLHLRHLGTDLKSDKPFTGAIRFLSTAFLDSVQEISGSLVLDQVSIERVELKNLRVIRGYGSTESLQLNQCSYLKQLVLPKLVAISSGNVVLRSSISSTLMCRLKASVDWKMLFQKAEQKLDDQKLLSVFHDGRAVDPKSFSCSSLTCNSSCGKLCWTQRDTDCQINSRCRNRSCPGQRPTCYIKESTNQEECCDSNCLGGCSSSSASSCFACKTISMEGKCDSSCPENQKYDAGIGKMIPLKEPWVRVGHVCMKSCPSPFVTDLQGRFCLAKCPKSQIIVEENRCALCAAEGESCETCNLRGRMLQNNWTTKACNVLNVEAGSFNVDATNLDSYSALDNFKSVRVIQAKIIMFKRTEKLAANISFLHNLKYVKGRLMFSDVVTQYLGLASLQQVDSLSLYRVRGLCRAWYPAKRIEEKFILSSSDLTFSNDIICSKAACDQQCEDECWGPGAGMCVACKNVSIGGTCYSSCEAGGQYSAKSKDRFECRPCHEQCDLGCQGPGATNCTRCRNFAEDGACVERCSKQYSADSSGDCHPISTRRVLLVLLVCAVVVGVLLIAALLLLLYFRRRMRKYEVVELDEHLIDSKNPSDMVELLVVNNDDLIKQKEIGSGAFGTVYKGLLLTRTAKGLKELPVAIKELRGKNPNLSQELLSEASVLARVRHPRCIRLVAVCMTQNVQLITTLMPRGCLLDFLKSHSNRISAGRMLNWAAQVADGMKYLESINIVHRDLAARNVLLQTLDDVKITDFGLAKLVDISDQEFLHTSGMLPVKWLGIECFESGVFSHKSDVWSFGVLLWEVCTYGESPYKPYRISSVQDITDILRKGIRLCQPPNCGIDLYNVMLSCWLPSPDSRPTFSELTDTMREFMKNPNQYIASSVSRGRSDDDDDEDGTVTFSGNSVQLRNHQQGPVGGYTPMSTVLESDDKAALVSGGSVQPNHYVPDPTSAARSQQQAQAEEERARLLEDRPDAARADDAGYLAPIASAAQQSRASDSASDYLQPRSLVTSNPVPIDDDYLAPNSPC